MREIFNEIYQAPLYEQKIAVATIISDRGSTPRNSGSMPEVDYQKNRLRVCEQTKLYIFSDGVYEDEFTIVEVAFG